MESQTPVQAVELARAKFERFVFDANTPALDFVNTLQHRGTEREYEWIESCIDALCWAERAGIVSPDLVESLAMQSDDETYGCLAAIRETRETIYGAMVVVIEKREDAPAAIERFNTRYAEVIRLLQVTGDGTGIHWDFPRLERDLCGFLDPLLHAAADLLTSGESNRIKRCANPTCRWLFYDTSKNTHRKWCSMTTCGNRAKAQRYYKFHKADPD